MKELKSRYIQQFAEKTHCPVCTTPVHILMDKNGAIGPFNPAFYICKVCGHIAEVGIGPVEEK